MASFRADQRPAVRLEQPNHLPHLHGTTLAYRPPRSSSIATRTAAGRSRLFADVARGTVLHMKVAFELPAAQAQKLRAEAERLGLSPEDLARAALSDLLAAPDDDFAAAARRVLTKNEELYRRLA